MKMYLNGVPIAAGTATLPLSGIIDKNCWLGRSQFSADPYFNGSYNELRIYRGLLSDTDVAADYEAGPDAVGADYVLHIIPSNNSLTITWGLSAMNMALQTSAVLGDPTAWRDIPDSSPAILDGRYSITVPISEKAAFYRLIGPGTN
jgi:hypothetical protein